MFDTSTDGIIRILEKGESQSVEFKSEFPSNHIVASNLAAFANTDGGIILFGIEDDGKIIGLSDYRAEYALDRLKRISESLVPYPITIGEIKINSKRIVYGIIEKAPSSHLPIMTSRGEIYKRQSLDVILISDVSKKESPLIEEEVGAEPSIKLTAFIAMSFRDEEEPNLIDYFQAMERAIKSTNLPIKIKRVDIMEGDYEISNKIMSAIESSDIVIADFTLNSPNVYFELGYARGKNRRIIQTARRGTVLEFDIRNWRTIFYRNATELEQKLIFEINSAYFEIVKSNKNGDKKWKSR